MHSPVGDQELLAARNFDVIHSSQIDSAFADQETPRLDQKTSVSKAEPLFDRLHQVRDAPTQQRYVQLILIREIGNPETTSEVACSDRQERAASSAARTFDASAD